MFLLADWAELITDEKGKQMVLSTIEALSNYRAMPLLKYLPFQNKGGTGYTANRAGASAAAATRVIGVDYTEAAPTNSPYEFAMRVAGGEMKIDNVMLKVGGAANNAAALKAGLLTQKLMDVGARLQRMWFTGDKAAGSGKEWTGANKFCLDEGRQTAAGADGAALTSAMLDDAIAKVPGANLITCNVTLANKINNFGQGVTKSIVLNQGKPVTQYFALNYKGIDIVPILQAPADADAVLADILPFNETQGASDLTSRVTVLRAGNDGIFGIQNAPLENLPEEQRSAFVVFHMDWLMSGFATDYKDAIYQIKGITNA